MDLLTLVYLAMLLKYMLSEGMHLSGVYFKSVLLSILSVGGISLHPVCLVSARRQPLETSC